MKAGISLLKNISNAELQDRLFSIGNHLDSGWDTIHDQSQKLLAAKTFLRAGKQAELVAAFPLAVQYITCAIQLIKPVYWKQEYDLSLKLTNTLAEISFNIKDFGIMQESVHQIGRQAKTVLDKIPSVSLLMKSYYSQKKYKEAFDLGKTTLKQLGENLPNIISETLVLPELQKTKEKLLDNVDNISSDEEENKNVKALAILRILSEMISLHSVYRPALRTYIVTKFMQIILKHGKSMFTPYGLATFGSVLFTELEDIRDSHRLGKMAISLIDDSKHQGLLSRVCTCYYISLSHWKEHIHSSLPPLLKSFKASLELGCSLPIESSSTYILLNYGINSICSGKPLEELALEWSTITQKLHQSNPMLDTFLTIICCLANKDGTSLDMPTLLKNDSLWSTYQASASNPFESFFVYLLRMILCYYFNEVDISYACIEKCQEFIDDVEQSYSYSMFFFYYRLISLAFSRQHPDQKPSSQIKVLPKLKKWSIHSSLNYLNKLYFLEAEMTITDKSSPQEELVHLYNESMSLARSSQFYHEEGLAAERMMEMFLESKKTQKATSYFNQALKGYDAWGCSAKVKELKGRYSSVIESLTSET